MPKSIQQIVQDISRSASLAETLLFVVQKITEELGADACSMFLCDDTFAEYVLVAEYGLNREAVGKCRIPFGIGLIGVVGSREEPLNLEDDREHPQYHRLQSLGGHRFHGFMGLPLIFQGKVLGILVLQQQEPVKFSEEQLAIVITLAAQMGTELAQVISKGALNDLFVKKTRRKKTDCIVAGIPGAKGIAMGRAVVVYPPADLDAVPDRDTQDPVADLALFDSALSSAREEVHEIYLRSQRILSVAENAIFEAYLRILDSRTLVQEVETEIKAGHWAQGALRRVIQQHVAQFEGLDDAYLRERAMDFRDLGRRILSYMQSTNRSRPKYPKNTILISEEVTATSILEIPEGHLVGIISGVGSGNSHVAILAHALNLPAVMSVGGVSLSDLAGAEVVVDGYHGQVYVSPSAVLKKEFRELIEEEAELDNDLKPLRDEPAETTDGHSIELNLNTGLIANGGLLLSSAAAGVGLYRTETPFMARDRFPSEEEQRIMYRQLLNTFNPRPVVMRTLDIGGDKKLPYFPITEENPFLGWRGVRVTLDHPDIFLQQLRAMLRANHELNNLSIMIPMVSSVAEVEASLRFIDQAFQELQQEGLKIKMPPVGLMLEVPAGIFQAYEFASRVDFISVGTNDLIQYLLAVDRNNASVADLYDGLHPAVLRALVMAVKGVHKAGKPISLCGELAGDPLAVILLVAMGFDSLSVSASVLLRTKWVIRSFSAEKAKQLLKEVLLMDDSTEVRHHMEIALDQLGLGGLIRAGK